MKQLVRLLVVFCFAVTANAGVTTHLKLDCRTGGRQAAAEGEELRYDASWYEDGDSVRITDNGTVLMTGTVGTYVWRPAMDATLHLLELEVLSGDEVVGTETVEFESGDVPVPTSATTHLKLDCRTGVRECSLEGDSLRYDTGWYEGGDSVRITDNGTVLMTGTVGVYVWQPTSSGAHDLRLEILSSGDVIGTETAQFAVVCIRPDGCPYVEIVDGIAWTFSVANSEAVVMDIPKDVAGDVTIPSLLGGRAVTRIDASAFLGCEALTSVTIPSSVTEIGEGAFYGCSRLTDVTFEGETVSSIAGDAFSKCHWDLLVHVPDGWTGRSTTLFGYSVVRDGASDSLKVDLTVTNVVVQYVLNSVQPEIAVPVSGDTGFVAVITEVKGSGTVSVPVEWKNNYPQFETMYGVDFGKALMKKSGKKDGAGNDMLVWQDFVAGTDPTDENDKFTASITLVDGVPDISYTPELTAEQKALRVYKTFGKVQLQDSDWTDITSFDGEAKKSYNFFKVTVEMK